MHNKLYTEVPKLFTHITYLFLELQLHNPPLGIRRHFAKDQFSLVFVRKWVGMYTV